MSGFHPEDGSSILPGCSKLLRIAQPGRALHLGWRGRMFESFYGDQIIGMTQYKMV